MKSVAIVLAAGRGSRMNSDVAKQYLLIKGKPVIWYSLTAFERCPFIDEIVLVTGSEEIGYCQKAIVEKYGFRKVKQVVEGGRERYHSVYQGILAAGNCDYIYIHDGAPVSFGGNIGTCPGKRVRESCLCGGNAGQGYDQAE